MIQYIRINNIKDTKTSIQKKSYNFYSFTISQIVVRSKSSKFRIKKNNIKHI